MAAVAAAAPKAAADPTRPLYHFRPPAQWMNDICSAFYYRGYHHIFYQFNPWTDKHPGAVPEHGTGWGHARSPNLVDWEFLPPVLLPSPATRDCLVASGSAMIRADGSPIILFTHTPIDFPQHKREQWAAEPLDEDLLSWRRLDIGLAAGLNGVPADIKPIWTDPFLFRTGDGVFATFKESNGLICQAQNNQLTAWKAVGHIQGADGECPNLFPFENRFVLIRSTYPISYLVGDFESREIAFHAERDPQIMDYAYGDEEIPYALMARGLYGTTSSPMRTTAPSCWAGSAVLKWTAAGTAACPSPESSPWTTTTASCKPRSPNWPPCATPTPASTTWRWTAKPK